MLLNPKTGLMAVDLQAELALLELRCSDLLSSSASLQTDNDSLRARLGEPPNHTESLSAPASAAAYSLPAAGEEIHSLDDSLEDTAIQSGALRFPRRLCMTVEGCAVGGSIPKISCGNVRCISQPMPFIEYWLLH